MILFSRNAISHDMYSRLGTNALMIRVDYIIEILNSENLNSHQKISAKNFTLFNSELCKTVVLNLWVTNHW